MTDEPKATIPGHIAYELDAKAETLPDFEIVTFEHGNYPDEVITYKDIVLNGRRLARDLLKNGIGKGDTFALVMRNHPEFIYSLYAATLIGAVMLPVDPRTKGERLAYILKDSQARGVIVTAEFLGTVEEALNLVKGVRIIGVSYRDDFKIDVSTRYPVINEILAGPEVAPPDNPSKSIDRPVEIIYTSGTTGDPKGVVIKGNRLTVYSMLAEFIWQYTGEDKLYTGLSLAHGNAQAVTLMPSLLMTVPSVVSRKFTKKRLWDICRDHACTAFSLLGGMAMGIISEPPQSNDGDNPVRLVLSAGTPKAIWEKFEKRFNVLIHEWYAAVEGGFAHKPPGFGPVGSFGKPLEGAMEMKVVRKDESECAVGETGEIICRMVGQKTEVEYLGKKEASEDKTRGGWLRSGDMGHVDENGWFFFDYRKGDALRRSGDFIQPEYVESVIAEHPEVDDLCAYGVPAASGAPGESDIVVALLPINGVEIDIQSVFRLCRNKLEGNAVPSFLQVVSELPKTISEKNLDRLLKIQFRSDAENVHKLEEYS